jgi:hypothetical protein
MTNNNPTVPASPAIPAFGFADGGSDSTHLFLVNPAAAPTAANDFANITRAALNKLLDDAISTDGMDGNTAQLVQYLLGAIDAATNHAVSA